MARLEAEWFNPVLHLANAELRDSDRESFLNELRESATRNWYWPNGSIVKFPSRADRDNLVAAQDDLRELLAQVIQAADAWQLMESDKPPTQKRLSMNEANRIAKAIKVRSPDVKQLKQEFRRSPTALNLRKLDAHARRDSLFWSIYERASRPSSPDFQLGFVHSPHPEVKSPFHYTLQPSNIRQWYGLALFELLRLKLDYRLHQCEWASCNNKRRNIFLRTNIKGPPRKYCCTNHGQYARKEDQGES